MVTTLMSAKGQLVLPAALRRERAWVPGTRFEVLATPEGVLLKPLAAAPAFAPTTLDAVFGMACYTGPVRTLADMDAAVAAEAARRR
jgi:AbrB family looped-hinge helix DNA binding protein